MHAGGREGDHAYLDPAKGRHAALVSTLWVGDEAALEATGNSAWFRRKIEAHAARVAVVAPSRFEPIRRSTKKTDKNDARIIALFLSRNMLPEVKPKCEIREQVCGMIKARNQPVKHRVPLINHVHAMFVRHGVKIGKDKLTGIKGLEEAVGKRKWSVPGQAVIDSISAQLKSTREN